MSLSGEIHDRPSNIPSGELFYLQRRLQCDRPRSEAQTAWPSASAVKDGRVAALTRQSHPGGLMLKLDRMSLDANSRQSVLNARTRSMSGDDN